MANAITVVYNVEDASEVVDVVVQSFPPLKDQLKQIQGIKSFVDLARTRDPTQIVFKYTSVDAFQRDILKSSRLTDEQKTRFYQILQNIGYSDTITFGIGNGPAPLIGPPTADAPPPMRPLVMILLDP